jgi:aminoglycoside 6-adenylyltransferase
MIDVIAAWGAARPDVRTGLLVGSQARTDTPADTWSDIDVVLLVDDPAVYLESGDWLAEIERPLLSFLEPTAVGGFVERRVLFESGQDVDFSIIAASRAEELVTSPETQRVLARGYRVLFDKLGLTFLVKSVAPPFDLAQLSSDFWYHALLTARKLRRGEVWVAKRSCDNLQRLVVELLAHRTGTVWHAGRFLEQWADASVRDELASGVAKYDESSIKASIRSSMDLFQRLDRPRDDVRAMVEELL